MTGVLVHFPQIWKKIKINSIKYVQFHMFNAICHMTRPVYFLFAAWEDYCCIKAPKQKASNVC